MTDEQIKRIQAIRERLATDLCIRELTGLGAGWHLSELIDVLLNKATEEVDEE